MNLINYVKGLIPLFKKDEVIDSCNLTKKSIENHTLEAYITAEKLFKDKNFKSKELGDLVFDYNKVVQSVPGTKIIKAIRESLDNSIVLLDYIAGVSKNEFSDTEASLALSYKKSTYLRVIQAASFVDTYAGKFLNYIYICETSELDNSDIKDCLLPIEIKWIKDNIYQFCLASKVLLTTKENFHKSIDGIPNATISELTETTFPTTIGMAKVDPFNLRGISASWNPFYIIGLRKVVSQVAQYKASQASLELLQLRKLNLEKLYLKQPDAALQKEIEYMQNRVDELNYELAKQHDIYN